MREKTHKSKARTSISAVTAAAWPQLAACMRGEPPLSRSGSSMLASYLHHHNCNFVNWYKGDVLSIDNTDLYVCTCLLNIIFSSIGYHAR